VHPAGGLICREMLRFALKFGLKVDVPDKSCYIVLLPVTTYDQSCMEASLRTFWPVWKIVNPFLSAIFIVLGEYMPSLSDFYHYML
jgi:hypothetical protein